MLLSDGGAPQPPVFLLSAEPVPPPVAAVAHAAPAVVATPREDTDVDVEDKAADHHIYNMGAIQEARSQVRSGTITTFKDFNTSVGRTTRQLCAAALGRVSMYTELEQRIRRNMEMRVLRRMEKFFKEDCVFYLHGGAVTPAVSNALAGAVIGLPAPPFTSGIVQAVTPVNETPAAVVGAPGSASALGTGRAVGPFTAVAGLRPAVSRGHLLRRQRQ